MSDLDLRLVELLQSDDGETLAHIEATAPIDATSLQLTPADDLEVGMLSTGVDSATVAGVAADIRARVAAGQTGVLKSHLDQLGITAAVLAWSSNG